MPRSTSHAPTRARYSEIDLRSVLDALCALRDGDFDVRLDPSGDGILGEIAGAFNEAQERAAHLTGELVRVQREVRHEGRIDERLRAGGEGTWATGNASANALIDTLVQSTTAMARVVDAVAEGDLSQRIELDTGTRPWRGELLRMGSGVNRMVEHLDEFAAEVTQLAREVGAEGRLGGQATPREMSGRWRDVTGAVNAMASRLTGQVRDIALVTTAVARGDLTRKVTVEATGELLELKETVNTMVDQLSSFADEVTRVAREVGTEGRLGGQARVSGVSGVWKDLTDNVNSMAGNLTAQVRNIAQVATSVANGDLSKKITVDAQGEILQLKDTLNTMVDQLSAFANEVTRVAREVGTEGRLGGQARVSGVSGVWKDLTDNVNSMAGNLTSQVRNIAQVATSVAGGDLTKKITVDAQGEILQLKDTLNTMVDQLSSFADEVTRVAREVGTEGRLGGRAKVGGVSGVWKDLTDNVNSMADNLTSQVRNIAQVTTAVANGDLTKKIDVDAQGEILELKTTINTMVDQLSAFAGEVTRVAREVGSEGRLGGQAEVEGVSGTWKRLTESVNELASNLTTQVRAIASVASAVARGDLTGSVSVEARGEVAELKDNVNLMVANLRETTRANQQQDWLKTNLARIAGLMQGHRDLMEVARLIMSEVTPLSSAQYGAFYLAEEADDGTPELVLKTGYGLSQDKIDKVRFHMGDGLVGQAALEHKPIFVHDLPAGYITVGTGLGQASPLNLIVLPILFESRVLGAIELASFSPFSEVHLAFFDQFVETIGVTINTITANSRTEALLAESQRLTAELQDRSSELQRQQEELQRSNAELEEKAALLAKQNRAIEMQNFQIEQARRTLEERAEQLAQSSRYKSEFLTNMSHELRTPLNSLLVLAKLLAGNPDKNLTPKQVELIKTIYESGSDLLRLINDILDLSKVEAGKMELVPQRVSLGELVDFVDANFRPLAVDKGLSFDVYAEPGLPEYLYTDEQRIQQVLRNLLSNAVKFTAAGEVRLTIRRANGVEFIDPVLARAPEVIGFAVSDTGIGIDEHNLRAIFEAFQQADGTTSRRYGGTGLGLSISRDIAQLLGGEIHVASRPGEGSTFTFYLPARYLENATDIATPVREERRRPLSAAPAEPVSFEVPEQEEEFESSPIDDEVLSGRKILIVDDDVRNIFALTCVLEQYGIEVLYAENGREGIDTLDRNEDVDLVLMDVMMPELDGYATTEAIRRMPQFADLPIIALTAKAMKGDREKSIESGASDYVPKPVDADHLLDIMRAWLNRPRT
ncbi:HAMP domain-containing protein [Actinoallomurus soli]|uniref:HAMP domain-containing protein n=1 Tax=Actinoallomurus soli TaxID=2952535 RepID=UPI002091EECE|nr:HAMP domain-containing protein [Actinoallomurus soli]MCO5975079.1 HAMP domain-containing protein [Actinoallomurus soli]